MQNLVKYLELFVTPERNKLFDRVLENRTRYITLLLEDIYQPHNASAVLRSCDCFGVQEVHIVENKNKYSPNPDVTLGSEKWLTMTKHPPKKNNTTAVINILKQKGYKIVATTPHENAINLDQFDITTSKTALLFGTEMTGLSGEAKEHADEFLKIPMYGFTESLNISVSVAIILQHLTHQLHQSNVNWKLSPDERQEIKLEWLKKSIKKSSQIIEKFNAQHQTRN